MRPPSRQPPVLPCGRPQDQLGNAARCRSHAMLLSLAFPLSYCTGLAVAGWQGPWGLTHPFCPSLPARYLPSMGLLARSSPVPLSSHPKAGSICGGGPHSTCQEPLPGAGAGAGDRQPFERSPSWEAWFQSWPGLISRVTLSGPLPCPAGKPGGAEGCLYTEVGRAKECPWSS